MEEPNKGMENRSIRITSLIIILTGVILLALRLFVDGTLDIALPLVFIVLGGGFFILVFYLRGKWNWALFLYVPGILFITFGFIFFLNVTTKDWNAWAYAWLLLLAAVGAGLLLANRTSLWPPLLTQIGWGLTLAGLAFFVIFGAIAGGTFIQISAPILLVLAGVSLRWLHLENILPGSILDKLNIHQSSPAQAEGSAQNAESLVEPLSSRELEVLRLIDSGITNQQIADRLSVAPSTVKTHINNIYGKLGVETRIQAVKRAQEIGILQK
jgi:DNA-binding CsgD family transcriptional regulator